MRKKFRQTIRYARFIVKPTGTAFALAGILIFMYQYLPKHAGWGLIVYIIGATLWTLDTVFTASHDLNEISQEIKRHQKNALWDD